MSFKPYMITHQGQLNKVEQNKDNQLNKTYPFTRIQNNCVQILNYVPVLKWKIQTMAMAQLDLAVWHSTLEKIQWIQF